MLRCYAYNLCRVKQVVQCASANVVYVWPNELHGVTETFLNDCQSKPFPPILSLRRGPRVSNEYFREQRKLLSRGSDSQCRHYSTAHEVKCWKCGRGLDKCVERFFCGCGMVQSVNECLNYFDVMGVRMTFELDPAALQRIFRSLQKNLHPDKFSKRSKTERDFSEQQSSLINKAYTTLVKPLSRGHYLLEMVAGGPPVEEVLTPEDTSFLMEMMELNEQLEEAPSLEAVEQIKRENARAMSDVIAEITQAFRNDAIEDAKCLLIKLNYLSNIDDKIKEIQQTYTGVI